MARYKRYNGRSSNEAALQHIEDARLLTIELGGTDQDVKKWFFSRTTSELDPILKKYRDTYGQQPYDYALKALPKWKSGRTKMSGTVAGRLFSLLPNFMPLDTKYDLVDSLWKHISVSKKRVVEAGAEADIEQIIKVVNDEVMSLATNWEIPEALNKRFNWLGDNDATTYQKLLSHIKDTEQQLAIKVMQEQIPILRDNFVNNWQDVSSNINYVIEIGKQSVELRIKADCSDIIAKDWSHIPTYNNSTNSSADSDFFGNIFTYGIIAFVLYLIFK